MSQTENLEVSVLPLVSNAVLPVPASPATRKPEQIPSGYGAREQCLPFTAAAALGFLIRSPITFGLSLPDAVPTGAHKFRSPLDKKGDTDHYQDRRVFYVVDDAECSFGQNAFQFAEVPMRQMGKKVTINPVQPGISFFDRPEQGDLFKLHLPYTLQTPPGVDALFLPALNRQFEGFSILSGLVETDWYSNPVNLVLGKPPKANVHIAKGDSVAQLIFIARQHRRPTLTELKSHARKARDLRKDLGAWYEQHAQDKSIYKKLARSRHGRYKSNSE